MHATSRTFLMYLHYRLTIKHLTRASQAAVERSHATPIQLGRMHKSGERPAWYRDGQED